MMSGEGLFPLFTKKLLLLHGLFRNKPLPPSNCVMGENPRHPEQFNGVFIFYPNSVCTHLVKKKPCHGNSLWKNLSKCHLEGADESTSMKRHCNNHQMQIKEASRRLH